jgi:predicted transcriptional regulator
VTEELKQPEERTKRISESGRGKAINFNPTKEQRAKFDALMQRTRRTQADLAREAIDDLLKKHEQQTKELKSSST